MLSPTLAAHKRWQPKPRDAPDLQGRSPLCHGVSESRRADEGRHHAERPTTKQAFMGAWLDDASGVTKGMRPLQKSVLGSEAGTGPPAKRLSRGYQSWRTSTKAFARKGKGAQHTLVRDRPGLPLARGTERKSALTGQDAAAIARERVRTVAVQGQRAMGRRRLAPGGYPLVAQTLAAMWE
jgi:hypothetical protein